VVAVLIPIGPKSLNDAERRVLELRAALTSKYQWMRIEGSKVQFGDLVSFDPKDRRSKTLALGEHFGANAGRECAVANISFQLA
jgi:hypothetical protein